MSYYIDYSSEARHDMLNKEEFDNEIQKSMDNIVNGQTVSQRTLKDMDGAMSNFKSGIVSEPIDPSDF